MAEVNAFTLVDNAIQEAQRDGVSQNEWARRVGIDPAKASRIRRRLALPTLTEAIDLDEKGGIPLAAWKKARRFVERAA